MTSKNTNSLLSYIYDKSNKSDKKKIEELFENLNEDIANYSKVKFKQKDLLNELKEANNDECSRIRGNLAMYSTLEKNAKKKIMDKINSLLKDNYFEDEVTNENLYEFIDEFNNNPIITKEKEKEEKLERVKKVISKEKTNENSHEFSF